MAKKIKVRFRHTTSMAKHTYVRDQVVSLPEADAIVAIEGKAAVPVTDDDTERAELEAAEKRKAEAEAKGK